MMNVGSFIVNLIETKNESNKMGNWLDELWDKDK